MAKKTSSKAGVKRTKRSRRVNKKIPVPMAHLHTSLTLWGLDSRQWLDNPLIWSSRGQPDPTMPIPSWGWFRFDSGRYHQINRPYGTQLPEPDDTLLPSTGIPNAEAPLVVHNTMDDAQGHDEFRRTIRQYGTRDASPNGGPSHALLSSTNPPHTIAALSLMAPDTVHDVQEGDSGQGGRSLSILRLTIPESFTESLPYTLSPSSMNSSDHPTYGSTPSSMAGSSSSSASSYTSSGPPTFQQQNFTMSAAPLDLMTGTTMSVSSAYSMPNSYLPLQLPAPGAGQNRSQHMTYLSPSTMDSSYLSAPSSLLPYSNMAEHSLASMIPYMDTVPNRRHTYNASHSHSLGDGHSLGTNLAGPSQVSQAPQTINQSHRMSAVLYGIGRRAHTTPAYTGNRQTPRNFPAVSSQLDIGTHYNWDASYLGDSFDINPNANPAAGGQSIQYTQNSGPSNSMLRWDPHSGYHESLK